MKILVFFITMIISGCSSGDYRLIECTSSYGCASLRAFETKSACESVANQLRVMRDAYVCEEVP